MEPQSTYSLKHRGFTEGFPHVTGSLYLISLGSPSKARTPTTAATIVTITMHRFELFAVYQDTASFF